jgi:UDP-N-acetylmuramoyl-L-alanyl-D-glutamate--2,6-diaminopimelate ligase
MKLNTLLHSSTVCAAPIPFPFGDMNVHAIRADSRLVESFDVFVAIPCPMAQDNIRDALNRGCKIVVTSAELADHAMFQELDALTIPHENPLLALAQMASVFYGEGPESVVAVTGTNGKTSTVTYVRQFMAGAKIPSASVGTLGLRIGGQRLESDATTDDGALLHEAAFDDVLTGASLTTLDSLRLHQLMARLRMHGVRHLAFEASSHGLDQYRLHGVHLKAAAFTNLTQDHLDYHQTMDAYFAVKARLFTEVLPHDGAAVLNKDTSYFDPLSALCQDRGQRIVTFSRRQVADLQASNIRLSGQGQIFDLIAWGQTYADVFVPVSGDFQIENILAALGLALASGATIEQCLAVFPTLITAEGRLECVSTHNDVSVYVDYAHTPDALEKAIQNVRPYTKGRLWVVFGCGGNRDAAKRPIMGTIAQTLADCCVVTDDNPRFEDSDLIRQNILAGMDGSALGNVHQIANRSDAICFALSHSTPGDTILIAGKGHEQGQLIGNTLFPFDDKTEVQMLLKKIF